MCAIWRTRSTSLRAGFQAVPSWPTRDRIAALKHPALIFAVLASAAALCAQSQTAPPAAPSSDTSLRRFEVGGQTNLLGLNDCLGLKWCYQWGKGAGAAINLNQYFAIDSSFDIMPGISGASIGDPSDPAMIGPAGSGRITDFFSGIRIEARARQWGIYARVRPGMMSWATGTSYGTIHDFAIEFGEGAEYVLTPRIHLRVEIDDLAIKYHEFGSGHCYPCTGNGWTGNNGNLTAGAYWSLGRPVRWNPMDGHAAPKHKFFDRYNLALMTASALARTSDDITTARFLREGRPEQTPFSRPFVRNGWPGFTGQAILWQGEEISLMYGLHRLHLHWLERIVPAYDAYSEAAAAFRNARNE